MSDAHEEARTQIAALKAALEALCDATSNWAANSYDINAARQNAWTVLAAVGIPEERP